MTESTYTIEDISDTELLTIPSKEDGGNKVTHRKKVYPNNPNPDKIKNQANKGNDHATLRSKLNGPRSPPSSPIKNDAFKQSNRNYAFPVDGFPSGSINRIEKKSAPSGLNNRKDFATPRPNTNVPVSAPSPPFKNKAPKTYSRSNATPVDDFPRTPVPSSLSIENQSTFEQFPRSSENKTSSHEEVIRKYLGAVNKSDDKEKSSSQEMTLSAHKNYSDENTIMEEMYLTTSSDFLSAYDDLSRKDFSKTTYQAPGRENNCKLCFGKERKPVEPKKMSDDIEKSASQDIPHLRYKNYSTANVIPEEMYLTTNSDFPSVYDDLSTKDFSKTTYQAPERNNKCKPCFGKEKKAVEPKFSRDTCSPQNCDKLNSTGVKKWKTCCYEERCSVNDPTSSTYNFLLKVRMCCGTKGCQLASKICDIYEPLVQIETNLDDIGEQQYHYLATDQSTDMYSKENEGPQQADEPASRITEDEKVEELEQLASGIREDEKTQEPDEPEQQEGLSLLADESEYVITLPEEDYRQSVYVDPEDLGPDSKRESAVSWSVPREIEPQGSTSQEQVITRATAEADKFRQPPAPVRHGSVFGEIVQKGIQDPTDLETAKPSTVLFKSKIDNMSANDSRHKQKW